MQYESISSMTVVSGYKYPMLLKEHLSFYHTVDTKIKMFTGFSIEGGTRQLIAAYFGIYSRLLCV